MGISVSLRLKLHGGMGKNLFSFSLRFNSSDHWPEKEPHAWSFWYWVLSLLCQIFGNAHPRDQPHAINLAKELFQSQKLLEAYRQCSNTRLGSLGKSEKMCLLFILMNSLPGCCIFPDSNTMWAFSTIFQNYFAIQGNFKVNSLFFHWYKITTSTGYKHRGNLYVPV